jgi:SAM-dependent methyltransferase
MPRLALVSSPRSGNMWLRRLLVGLVGGRELSADTPAAIPWEDLPASTILQLHWPPEEQFVGLLRANGFSIIALMRHPLDVLISILQFAQTEPRTARWLNGAEGNELDLLGADPCSEAFRSYARSARAHALMGVTPAWLQSGRLDARVRYEDLVSAPVAELARLVGEVKLDPLVDLEEPVRANSLERLRSEESEGHFWRGQPGTWRFLLPPPVAGELAASHTRALAAGGYTVEPDPGLTDAEARQRWLALAVGSSRPSVAAPGEGGRLEAELEIASGDSRLLVEQLYRLVLRRHVDAGGLQTVERLEGGSLSVSALLQDLVTSREARAVRAADDAVTFARWARREHERPRELFLPAVAAEGVVAAAWALSRVSSGGRVLDVGSTFADAAYLAGLHQLDATTLVCVDPSPVDVPGLEVTRADVRDLPFDRSSFDTVLCLGTLQHIGCDNRIYGLPAERDPGSVRRALHELRRVLRPGGQLLVTVPCGDEQELGLLVQRPAPDWLALFAAAGFFVFEHEQYELTSDGWRSREELPAGLRYGERGAGAGGLLCAELRPGRLRNAARRAAAGAVRTLVEGRSAERSAAPAGG